MPSDLAEVNSSLEDPIWEYVLIERLKPYIPYVRKWWAEREELAPLDTGVYLLEYDAEQPPGLYYRFTRTAVRSPIKGVQTFPFVVAAYLQITGVKGGSTKLIQRKLLNELYIDEFRLIDIHNLPSTFNQGQLVAFVPREIYDARHTQNGKWVYLNNDELEGLLQRSVTETLFQKAVRRG